MMGQSLMTHKQCRATNVSPAALFPLPQVRVLYGTNIYVLRYLPLLLWAHSTGRFYVKVRSRHLISPTTTASIQSLDWPFFSVVPLKNPFSADAGCRQYYSNLAQCWTPLSPTNTVD